MIGKRHIKKGRVIDTPLFTSDIPRVYPYQNAYGIIKKALCLYISKLADIQVIPQSRYAVIGGACLLSGVLSGHRRLT